MLKGHAINGPMLVKLAESYIEAINTGKIPTIENAFNYLQAHELQKAYDEVMKEHESTFDKAIIEQFPLQDKDFE